MRKNISITEKEIMILIFLSMLFAVCESLSIELNNFFHNYIIYGYHFSFNVSVVFFCVGFFIIDLITELYNDKFALYFIYSKMISQFMFICFGILAIKLANIENGQIAKTFLIAPHILFNAMIASLAGYKMTGKIMQLLKIKFKGRFLFTRYLSSTIPGEIAFSFIFTVLSFSHGRNVFEITNIFLDLIVVKFLLSTAFGVLVVPLTNVMKHYLKLKNSDIIVSSIPF